MDLYRFMLFCCEVIEDDINLIVIFFVFFFGYIIFRINCLDFFFVMFVLEILFLMFLIKKEFIVLLLIEV